MAQSSHSVDAWLLMALVHRNLDDLKFQNAMMLSERLYAIDKNNNEYRYLYAKSLYLRHDYDASYSVLSTAFSIPCLYLFGLSCLDLGKRGTDKDNNRRVWLEGVKAVTAALEQHPEQSTHAHAWGNDLASVTARNHMPTRASLCALLGDLYTKLENVRTAAIYFSQCLKHDPFDLSAFLKLCELAPDVSGINVGKLPDIVYKEFTKETDLSRSDPSSPSPPLPSLVGIRFQEVISELSNDPRTQLTMPIMRGKYHDLTLEELRALVHYNQKGPRPLTLEELNSRQPQRDEREEQKDDEISKILEDIAQMKAAEAYKNKHGLHKKPPVDKQKELEVGLLPSNDDTQCEPLSPSALGEPPRLFSDVPSPHTSSNDVETSKRSQLLGKKRSNNAAKANGESSSSVAYFSLSASSKRRRTSAGQQLVDQDNCQPMGDHAKTATGSLYTIFNIDSQSYAQSEEPSDEISGGKAVVVDAMNRLICLLKILANGYMYQSLYGCREAALELQKLDNQQYDTAWVLSTIGKAYYNSSDYLTARVFFRRSFAIAPWFCDEIPLYSTCLWYLENSTELNLLAYKVKHNMSHQYEAFIAAGNWAKCSKEDIEATKWFQKAVEVDPSRPYGHCLLGYEDWEKGNYLGAKQHFAECMIANRRSHMGWFGMAVAYMNMDEHMQARNLLAEAIRLNPRHPVALGTMAEVLFALSEYDQALRFAETALKMRSMPGIEKLKRKIIMLQSK
ncbi:uncharacterized protein BYT42DRAFT_647142 [Radiomyces spectabilis]|uniref:uncharacterized protein n=1 Tax=Radiomyces spectabilis TaxID=64574 RepID=UPI00221F217A|nr:uncharacterized protein BYT42DRAFT_647142 [Radiomyces spectabilis]KAI8373218.1 hypothetical protein BYT42DRAFT_647142 [Radiomyces spectabilis]